MALVLSVHAESSNKGKVQFFCNNKHTFAHGSAGAHNVEEILASLNHKAEASIGKLVKDKRTHPDLFGIAQCEHGISKKLCAQCLKVAIDSIKNECANTKSTQLIIPKICLIQYDIKEIKN